MVTHTRNLCSAFNPSKCIHTVVNIHPEQWAANAAAPREQLGVRYLAQGSHLSRGIQGEESAGYSLPPPTIPARPETRTHDLRVTSPTLYPLGHDCPWQILFVKLHCGLSISEELLKTEQKQTQCVSKLPAQFVSHAEILTQVFNT